MHCFLSTQRLPPLLILSLKSTSDHRWGGVLAACMLMVLTSSSVPAAQLTATGLSLPFFAENGRLTHRMTAKHGVIVGDVQHLREVELVFFSATDPDVIVQKLITDEATWNDKQETLSGRGSILVATEENRLTGEGFQFVLATSLLEIHRDFTMSNEEVVATSDRATVELILHRDEEQIKFRDVRRSEAIGNLVVTVQPTARKKYEFEKVYSERAIYDGEKQTIVLPQPSRTVGKKGEGRAQTMTIELPKKSAKSAP